MTLLNHFLPLLVCISVSASQILLDDGDSNSRTITLYKCNSKLSSNNFVIQKNLIIPADIIDSSTDSSAPYYAVNLVIPPSKLNCSSTANSIQIDFEPHLENEELTVHLNVDGYLRLIKNNSRVTYYNRDSFCVERVTPTGFEIQVCPAHCSQAGKCFQKCCPPKSVISRDPSKISLECIPAPEDNEAALWRIFPTADFADQLNKFPMEIIEGTGFADIFPHFDCSVDKFFENQRRGFPRENLTTSGAENSECVDHFFDNSGKDSRNELVKVNCNYSSNSVKFRSIQFKSYNMLYKCSEDVKATFISIPPSFQMEFDAKETMNAYFMNSTGFTSLYDFTLKTKKPNCVDDTFEVTVPYANNLTFEDGHAIYLKFSPDAHVAYLYKDSFERRVKKEMYFHRDNFCISRIEDASISVRMCKSKCSHTKEEKGGNMCIPKCCFFGGIKVKKEDGSASCKWANRGSWAPTIYKNELTDKTIKSMQPQYYFYEGAEWDFYNCSYDGTDKVAPPFVHLVNEYRVLSNGRILTRKTNRTHHEAWEEVFTGDYPFEFCMDGLWDKSRPFLGNSTDALIIRCAINRVAHIRQVEKKIRTEQVVLATKILLLLVYLPCLFVYLSIILVYASIWEKSSLRNDLRHP